MSIICRTKKQITTTNRTHQRARTMRLAVVVCFLAAWHDDDNNDDKYEYMCLGCSSMSSTFAYRNDVRMMCTRAHRQYRLCHSRAEFNRRLRLSFRCVDVCLPARHYLHLSRTMSTNKWQYLADLFVCRSRTQCDHKLWYTSRGTERREREREREVFSFLFVCERARLFWDFLRRRFDRAKKKKRQTTMFVPVYNRDQPVVILSARIYIFLFLLFFSSSCLENRQDENNNKPSAIRAAYWW
jgi:hypothetical protein